MRCRSRSSSARLRRTVVRPGLGKITLTLVTTLLDPMKYPADDLLELRLRRWDVETNIGHLKTTMKMDVLRCKTEAGHPQGAGGLLPGLQPGASGDAGSVAPAGRAGEPHQLRRRLQMDASRQARRQRCRN